MCNFLKRILNPFVFQGNLRKSSYFEGWYYKLVDHESQNMYAVIPGVSFNTTDGKHAFIQVINGNTSATYYIRFDISKFSYSRKDKWIKIENNYFSLSEVILDLKSEELVMKGELRLGTTIPWPVTLISPGAMGWYAYVPFMECYHGIISFDHELEGELCINDQHLSFHKGRGYIEKDWGKSFPKYYIWTQCNHFSRTGISLMASIANIPWLGRSFDGFLIGLWLDNRLYKFTTYNGSKIKKLRWDQHSATIHIANKHHRIEIEVKRTLEPGTLKSPKHGGMTDRIRESMTSLVHVKLFDLKKHPEEMIFEDQGNHAGFEMGGAIDQIKIC